MENRSIFLIIAVTALFSALHIVGYVLTYSRYAVIHSVGTLLYTAYSIWSVAAAVLAAKLHRNNVSSHVTIVPAVSAFLGLPFVYIAFSVLSLDGTLVVLAGILLQTALLYYAFKLMEADYGSYYFKAKQAILRGAWDQAF